METVNRQLDCLLQVFESNEIKNCCQNRFYEPLNKLEKIVYRILSVMTHGRLRLKSFLIEDLSSCDSSFIMDAKEVSQFMENIKRDCTIKQENLWQKNVDHVPIQEYLVNYASDIAIEKSNVGNSENTPFSGIEVSPGIISETPESEQIVEIAEVIIMGNNSKIKNRNLQLKETQSKGSRYKRPIATIEKSENTLVVKKRRANNFTREKRRKLQKSKIQTSKGQLSNTDFAQAETSYTVKIISSENAAIDSSNTEKMDIESDRDGDYVESESQSDLDTKQEITSQSTVQYKQFICVICQLKKTELTKEYDTYKDLMQHMLDAHVQPKKIRSINGPKDSESPYMECEICDHKLCFSKKNSILRKISLCSSHWLTHQISKHGASIPHFVETYRCEVKDCNVVSVVKYNVKIHRKERHEAINVTCEYCQKTMLKRTLVRHLKVCEKLVNRNEREQFPCPRCEKSYLTKHHLKEHVAKVHDGKGEKILCSMCPKVLCSRASLQGHMLSIHNINMTEKKVISCDKCPFKGFQKQLEKHMITHEAINVTCEYCQETMLKRTLVRHLKVCEKLVNRNEKEQFPCPHCEKSLLSKYHLKQHVAKVHDGKRETILCPMCSKVLLTAESFQGHMLNIHNIKITEKKVINVPLKDSKKTLEKDMITHAEKHKITHAEKKFKCLHCNFQTTERSYLKVHFENIHFASCPWCPYKTGWQDEMREHEKTCTKKTNPDQTK